MKKESNLKRLLRYAGGYKYLAIASWILSALSALAALLPFVYIWKVIKEVLDVAPDYGAVQELSHNGWMAVVFAATETYLAHQLPDKANALATPVGLIVSALYGNKLI